MKIKTFICMLAVFSFVIMSEGLSVGASDEYLKKFSAEGEMPEVRKAKLNDKWEDVREYFQSMYSLDEESISRMHIRFGSDDSIVNIVAPLGFMPDWLEKKPETDEDFMEIGNTFIEKEKELFGLVDLDEDIKINKEVGPLLSRDGKGMTFAYDLKLGDEYNAGGGIVSIDEEGQIDFLILFTNSNKRALDDARKAIAKDITVDYVKAKILSELTDEEKIKGLDVPGRFLKECTENYELHELSEKARAELMVKCFNEDELKVDRFSKSVNHDPPYVTWRVRLGNWFINFDVLTEKIASKNLKK